MRPEDGTVTLTNRKSSPRGWGSVRRGWLLAIPLACTVVTAGEAQIRTDGTLGGPAVALAGPNFLINEALGRLAGSNLFHSFQVFNVGSVESATFVTTTAGLANVISRVTGGSASQINGLVRLDAANAAPNFFFINPAGVVFGKGAQIDVPAGFHVSTANYLRFPDGNFYADPKAVSTLSSAAPEAFGFLGTTRAAITIKEGALLQTTSPQADQPISIVAGDIAIDGGRVATVGSEIRAIAVGPGVREVGLTGPLPAAFGDLGIVNGGVLISKPDGATKAGDILVAAGDVLIDGRGNGSVFTGLVSQALQPATGNAGNLTINATGTLAVVNAGTINADTRSAGRGGAIKVTAGDAVVDGGSVSSSTRTGSSGDAGSIDVVAAGTLAIGHGGVIQSNTVASGRAGAVKVTTGDLTIDGKGSAAVTGIISSAAFSSVGNAGDLEVTTTGKLAILNGGRIDSSTGSPGRAGAVTVSAGMLLLVNGGVILSNALSSGNAGTVKVSAGDLVIDGGASATTGISSSTAGKGHAGIVDVAVTRDLTLARGGQIVSNTFSAGNAGGVKVRAGSLTIDGAGSAAPTGLFSTAFIAGGGRAGDIEVTTAGALSIVNGGSIDTATFSSGTAGTIKVSAGTLSIASSGTISSDTLSSGNAGVIKVTAGDMAIDGTGTVIGSFTGISSSALEGTGKAGNVDLTVNGTLALVNGGSINSSTLTSGSGGTVKVSAGNMTIDAKGSGTFTGVASSALDGTGSAGNVDVAVSGKLAIVDGGTILTSTRTSGQAGQVRVSAGDLAIDGQGAMTLTGISSTANEGKGNAGTVDVAVAGDLSILRGGQILSDTFSAGDAGVVKVRAGTLAIDGKGLAVATGIFSSANRSSQGNAGDVEVTTAGMLTLANGGSIDTSTQSRGQAGTVKVVAGNILIDGRGSTSETGIASEASSGTGNAGSVDVTAAGELSIVNQGVISSSTITSGRAGSVRVNAGTLSGDTNAVIGAIAATGSSGQTGTVSIQATEGITLSNGAEFSIRNEATVANPASLTPTSLTVTAPNISLTNDGQITAASSGNVAASNIRVNFGPQLTVSNARISTSAQDGNGGSISVSGTGVLVLQNGQITTSVAGTQGNGGDIGIETPIMVMQTGFIQANTAATNASGGNVNIEVDALLPSGSTLFVGGPTPYAFAPGVFGFNVIQAAAPTGVSGTIRISTPVLDITGSLSVLPARFLDADRLGRSRCAIVGGSSLSRAGRGALPPAAGDLLWLDPVFEVPGVPAAGSPRSGALAPRVLGNAGTGAAATMIRCWGAQS
jgi:filamentous hemagglutinin family protein